MNAFTKISIAELSEVTPELQQNIERFLYLEAELLDNRGYEEWFDLLADDIRYYMPVSAKVMPDQQREGFTGGFGGAIFDEDKGRMAIRIRKILSGRDVIERPHSMLRHMVTNVRIGPGERDGEYRVLSYFRVSRVRDDDRVDVYTGENEHVLRRDDNPYGWLIARRTILLDQTVVLGGGIGFFF